MTEAEMTQKRMIDLSRMCYERGIYTYSDFLTLAEQSDFDEVTRTGKLYTGEYTLFGGCDGAERVMVRFGSEDSLGFAEPWPIACIKIEPLNRKFAEQLTHRDVLGSLMNLGIERHLLGDIIFSGGENQNCIYIFVKEHIGETLCRELTRIKHTSVQGVIITDVDARVSPVLEKMTMQVKSERIDLVVAHVFKLSRNQAAELFAGKKVFLNGRLLENESHILKPEDTISVRGFGRFIYRGVTGTTKKGNLNVSICKYV